jgi:hypothetical protein
MSSAIITSLTISNEIDIPSDLYTSYLLPAFYGNIDTSSFNVVPVLGLTDATYTLTSFSIANTNAYIGTSQISNTEVNIHLKASPFTDEVFEFTNIPNTNLSGLTKWQPPDVKILTINLPFTLNYTVLYEGDFIAIDKTETGYLEQMTYWEYSPSIAKFQNYLEEGNI